VKAMIPKMELEYNRTVEFIYLFIYFWSLRDNREDF